MRASVTAPLAIEWEHLLYDGGSTDGTPDLLAQAAAAPGPPPRYWQQRQRPGRGRNQNSFLNGARTTGATSQE